MNLKTIANLLVVTLCVTAFASAQDRFEDPTLVGRWTMRNTGGTLVEDFSGYSNFGSLRGASFFKSDATVSSSVEIMDGSGEVPIPHSANLEPARGTVSTYIKVAQLSEAHVFFKVSSKTVRTNRRDGVGGAVYGVSLLADGSMRAYVMNDDPNQPSQWVFADTIQPVIKAGTWHHVALQWDGKFVRLFIDGNIQAKMPYREIAGKGLSYYGESDFTLAPGHAFIGEFGETRIYNRVISDDEIKLNAAKVVSK